MDDSPSAGILDFIEPRLKLGVLLPKLGHAFLLLVESGSDPWIRHYPIFLRDGYGLWVVGRPDELHLDHIAGLDIDRGTERRLVSDEAAA